MGYQTSFRLSVLDSNLEETENYCDIICQFKDECDDADYALEEDGSSAEYCKWYDHEEDIREFSKKHPELIFLLEGEGEETGDMWKLYVSNGMIQECPAIITYDEFDEIKLR